MRKIAADMQRASGRQGRCHGDPLTFPHPGPVVMTGDVAARATENCTTIVLTYYLPSMFLLLGDTLQNRPLVLSVFQHPKYRPSSGFRIDKSADAVEEEAPAPKAVFDNLMECLAAQRHSIVADIDRAARRPSRSAGCALRSEAGSPSGPAVGDPP